VSFKALALHIYSGLKRNAYTLLYETFFSNPRLCQEAGLTNIADQMITFGHDNQRRDRAGCIRVIREAVHEALNTHWKRRTEEQIKLVHIIVQKNMILERSFENWPSFQVADLCRHVELRTYDHLEQIYQAGEQGDCAFIVLRGLVRGLLPQDDKLLKIPSGMPSSSVRMYSQSSMKNLEISQGSAGSANETTSPLQSPNRKKIPEASPAVSVKKGLAGSPAVSVKKGVEGLKEGHSPDGGKEGEEPEAPTQLTLKQMRSMRGNMVPNQTVYKKVVDLRVGECFGNRALDGNGVRNLTMIAMGPVELALVPGEAMRKIRFHEECTLSTDEKVAFLQTLQLFAKVDLFKLYRIALKMRVKDIAKDEKIFEQDSIFDGLAFIFEGSVFLVSSKKKHKTKHKKKAPLQASSRNSGCLRLATLSKGRYFGEASLLNVKFPKNTPKEKELVTAIAGLNLRILILPSSAYDLLDQGIVDVIVRGHEEHCLFLQERQKQIKQAMKNLTKSERTKFKNRSAKKKFATYFPPKHDWLTDQIISEAPPKPLIDMSMRGQAGSMDGSRVSNYLSSLDSSRRSSADTIASNADESLLPSIFTGDNMSVRSSISGISYGSQLVSRSVPSLYGSRSRQNSSFGSYGDQRPISESAYHGNGKGENYFKIDETILNTLCSSNHGDQKPLPSCKGVNSQASTPETSFSKVFFPENILEHQEQTPTSVPYAGRLRGMSTTTLLDVQNRSCRGSIAAKFARARLSKAEGDLSQEVWKSGAWKKRPSLTLDAPTLHVKAPSECDSSTTFDTETTENADNVKLKHSVCSATSFVDRPMHWSPKSQAHRSTSNHISKMRVSLYQPKDTQEITVSFIKKMLEDKRIEKDAEVLGSEVQTRKSDVSVQRASLTSIPSISSGPQHYSHRKRPSQSNELLLPILGASSNI